MERKLRRSRQDNVIAGVCGGVAKYLNIDVTIVRIVWVIAALLGGPGFIAYLICAIVIPKESGEEVYEYEEEEPEVKDHRNKMYLGLALIALGGYFGFQALFPNFEFKFLWPIVLIGVGVLLINRHHREEDE